MPQYIRRRHPGGTFFFTARLADRTSTLLIDEVDQLREATRKTIARYPFSIDAIAVLPNAIHTIWTLPPRDSNFALRWSMLKSTFTRSVPAPPHRTPAQVRRKDKGIWQPRYWEHLIKDPSDLAAHIQMIHASPVQAGLCPTPLDWPHSSVHRYVAEHGSDTLKAGVGYGRPRNAPKLTYAPTFREEGFAHHP